MLATDMLENFKALRDGRLSDVDNRMLYPLMRWCSSSIVDLHHVADVNRIFFWVPDNVIKQYLYSGLRETAPFIRYPKAEKAKEDKAEELRRELIMRSIRLGERTNLKRTQVYLNSLTLERLPRRPLAITSSESNWD